MAGSELIPDKLTLVDQNGLNPITIQNVSGVLVITGIMKGTATLVAGDTSIVVTHGCGATPTSVTANPSQNIGNVWITDIGATTFKINTSASTGTDTTFYWKARV